MGEKGPKRRWRTGCLVAVGLAVMLIGGCVGYRLHLRSRVKAELQAIRDAGYPATLEELDAWYPEPPPGENAADVLLAAFDLLVERDKHSIDKLPPIAELPPRGEPLPEEMKKAMAEHLEANREALELLHRGARMKQSRYPVDFTMGVRATVSHLTAIRDGVRLLALNAILHAERGEGDLAAAAVLDCVGMGSSLRKEPLLISQLVRIGSYGIAVGNLQWVLSRMPLTDPQLAELAAATDEAEAPEVMTRALIGERCLAVSVYEMVRDRPSALADLKPELNVRLVPLLYAACGLLDRDMLTYLKMEGEVVRMTELPLSEQLPAARVLEAEVEESLPSHAILTLLFMPTVEGAIEVYVRSAAQLRAARTALALERHRLTHGTLPGRLADLVPEYMDAVPEDPFDGKPLRYKRLPKGYIVYSIGADGRDDGGAEGTFGAEDPDVTFTVER